MSNVIVKLSELKPGDKATIHGFNQTKLSIVEKRKLLSMGVTPRSKLILVRRAPMGSGIELAIKGSKLCMRQEVADLIEVTVNE